MKKHQPRPRKRRKCERGIKTKSLNKGAFYQPTIWGLQPIIKNNRFI